MLGFKQFISENTSVESLEWSKPLYHGTSLSVAKKIIDGKQFQLKDTSGVNEMGRGIYLHPSMNRTSPWVHLASKNGNGAIIELSFTRPLKLAIKSRGMGNERSLIDQGFDGVYDKNGATQVPHQVLLFNYKPLGGTDSKLNSEIIDWGKSKLIPYDKDKHDYLSGYEDKEQKQYY